MRSLQAALRIDNHRILSVMGGHRGPEPAARGLPYGGDQPERVLEAQKVKGAPGGLSGKSKGEMHV